MRLVRNVRLKRVLDENIYLFYIFYYLNTKKYSHNT
ncbi:hypothetical protein TDE_1824 [Treponema denticola ATCC 35405]|uniref:Uncharacterized protein n=1 Tax=Treponema denticola (strain ATCC 35405 / DSM 14222 / CIP 103919 / JCM 8153 / KCTC 15104) TaxID=243275 RepID=Q73LN8_TREDE|nr:hypothetical protein TDE_1824 [Treponema denticola ATCC 35405]